MSQRNERVVQTIESIDAGAACDKGLLRDTNEDRCFFRAFTYNGELGPEKAMIAAVADGMGGHSAGEAASERAVQVIASKFAGMSSRIPSRQLSPDWRTLMREALIAANREVYEEARRSSDRAGMGTTLTGIVVLNDVAHIGHVGDSRVYLIRNGGITRLTSDHTWIAKQVREGRMTVREGRCSDRRGQLTQAIGLTDTIDPDIETISIGPGDRIVLCTDGITEMLTDMEIFCSARTGIHPQKAAKRLVYAANRAGGYDNMAAVVIDCLPEPSSKCDMKMCKLGGKRPRWAIAALAVVIALIIADAAYLMFRYAGRDAQSSGRTDNAAEMAPGTGGAKPGILDLGGAPAGGRDK